MRNTRALAMIGIALVVGLVAMVAAARWLSGQASVMTTKVVVASRDLDIAVALGEDAMQAVEWPTASKPKGAMTDSKTLLGRVTRVGLAKGEPILEEKLAPQGSKAGLAALIDKGKRALTVKVNEVIGVAGFALPGNYVDILVNVDEGRGRDKSVSKIVLERIMVLAVAQEASRDETKPKVVSAVTLEVTPEQAEVLDLARSIGTLSLVLRNQVDETPVITAGARHADLLHTVPAAQVAEAPKAAEPPKPAPAPVKRVVAKRKPIAPPPVVADSQRVEVIKGVARGNADY